MKNSIKIHFLGASGVVTGSKFLIETSEKNILIDCGMFQGMKELRELNWKDLPIDVSGIDTVLITHGHLDHVGYLPRLFLQGFRGKILGTAPTLAIAEIILMDSAKIHEEEAKKANKENYTKHSPALPFYTIKDVEKTVGFFLTINENKWIELAKNSSCRFQYNGHIIGSTFIELEIDGKRLVFSGDVGRKNDYLLRPPAKPKWADYLFLESTYGNRIHSKDDLETMLPELIKDTLSKKGNLVIPSFAVERLQTLIYVLWKLYKNNKIPKIPIYVDSPMGNNVLQVFKEFPEWHKLSENQYNAMRNHATIIQSYKETWEVIDNPQSKIIIAGSGMVTGGRVLTYLQYLIGNPSTTVLLVGYQAEGTRGRKLQDGIDEIKIYGKYFPVKATIKTIGSLSAHADQHELIDWTDSIVNTPEKVFLVHGEQEAAESLKVQLQQKYNWNIQLPKLFESEDLNS
jgi:metallo-beta-lactamase family protein